MWNSFVSSSPSVLIVILGVVDNTVKPNSSSKNVNRAPKRKADEQKGIAQKAAAKSFVASGVATAVDNKMAPQTRAAKTKKPASVPRTKPSEVGEYQLIKNEVLNSPHGHQYEVLEFLGKGTFGQVVKALKKGTDEVVAIKILKNHPHYTRQAHVEVSILSILSKENAEEFNFVQAFESFNHKTHACLVFEMLGQNLWDFAKQNRFTQLPLNAIRPIWFQVLTALQKLKSLSLIHADLKPENIMLVDPYQQPYRVKIIDFGSAYYRNKTVPNTYMQSRYYRAPEIILGLPYNESIDMWSLGCLVAELFLGWPLYPGKCEYDQIRFICQTQGIPPLSMLQSSPKRSRYFKEVKTEIPNGSYYSLKTIPEYESDSPTTPKAKESRKYILNSIDEIIQIGWPQVQDSLDNACTFFDRREFVDVLKKHLVLNPDFRMTPTQGLESQFVTMAHFNGYGHANYFREAQKRMEVCKRNRGGTTDPTPSSSGAADNNQQVPQQPMVPIPNQMSQVPTTSMPPAVQQMATVHGNPGQFFYPAPPQPLYQNAALHRPFASYLQPLLLSLATNPSQMIPQMVSVPTMDVSMLQKQWLSTDDVAQQFAALTSEMMKHAPPEQVPQLLSSAIRNRANPPQFQYPGDNSNRGSVAITQQQAQQLLLRLNGNTEPKPPAPAP